MKPQSCRNCGKELQQSQRICPSCGKDSGYDDTNKSKWIYGTSNLFTPITNMWYSVTFSMSVFSASQSFLYLHN